MLGTVLAVMRVSPVGVLRGLGAFYVNTVRNTPLTLILRLLRRSGVLYILQVPLAPDDSPTSIRDNAIRWAIVGLADLPRGVRLRGAALGRQHRAAGQAEAARAIGLTFGQSLREVILPQAFRGAIAPLGIGAHRPDQEHHGRLDHRRRRGLRR